MYSIEYIVVMYSIEYIAIMYSIEYIAIMYSTRKWYNMETSFISNST